MASYSTNEFRGGLKVMLDGDPCEIIENEFVKPGKGQAFNRVRLRNLKSGRVWERTFKSGESLEAADVVDREMQYLYNDGTSWCFMDPASFDQVHAGAAALGDRGQWLREQDVCTITLYNGEPLAVAPPNHVVLKVTYTEPGIRGDTATGATKTATVEGGATVKVPLFVEIGDALKIDTRTGAYLSRVKE